jgi:hypothetical protein
MPAGPIRQTLVPERWVTAPAIRECSISVTAARSPPTMVALRRPGIGQA